MQSDFFFTWNPLLACRQTYMSNPFVECPLIADYLKKHTDADDTIAVLGSEPEIFFDAQRHSATGYIYTYGLVEVQPLALEMQKKMIAEIEAAKPKYVVFANVRCSWLLVPNSEKVILVWADRYLDAYYEKVAILEPVSPAETAYFWDSQIQGFQQRDESELEKVTQLDTIWKQLDYFWKLWPYNVPVPNLQKYMQKYWGMPYITVYRRKA
jgi:hypothetical protein